MPRLQKEFASYVIHMLDNLKLEEPSDDQVFEDKWARVTAHWFPPETDPSPTNKTYMLEVRARGTDNLGRVRRAYLYRPNTGNDCYPLYMGWRVQMV